MYTGPKAKASERRRYALSSWDWHGGPTRERCLPGGTPKEAGFLNGCFNGMMIPNHYMKQGLEITKHPLKKNGCLGYQVEMSGWKIWANARSYRLKPKAMVVVFSIHFRKKNHTYYAHISHTYWASNLFSFFSGETLIQNRDPTLNNNFFNSCFNWMMGTPNLYDWEMVGNHQISIHWKTAWRLSSR